ncbi:hypothetical protein QBC34DRAFT_200954 [Podospora aff. communis PSN243]|uniref:CULT domain-containing protein n=1 Tax=Podospora aff. communis PSN243 TaxID=3040156 RepID=A0AAV9G8V4_9PEZI|nr:hypothetical protein QBC34DRAFT_200954 [Podospora aff. communis PSN243]
MESEALLRLTQPWPGNLPCCRRPNDGCDAHNPSRLPIFWDNSLPATPDAVNPGLWRTLVSLFRVRRQDSSDAPPPQPLITCALPRNSATCTPLPPIHRKIPYMLSFYHVFAAVNDEAERGPGSVLSLLSCRGTRRGLRPRTWNITPRVVDSHFLIEHDYRLPLAVEHPQRSSTRGYYSKRPLMDRKFASFSPCPHCTWILRTVTEKVNWHGVRSVPVSYALHNVLGQQFRDEWRSDVGRQPTHMSCGMCYTDFSMRFEEEGHNQPAIEVQFAAFKDLGGVGSGGASGERWNAAAGSLTLQRPSSDRGRIRRTFRPTG